MMISPEIIKAIDELYEAYAQLDSDEQLFYPQPLKQALKRYHHASEKTIKQVEDVYKAFLNHTFRFQYSLFPSLLNFSKLSSMVIFSEFKEMGLLDAANNGADFELLVGPFSSNAMASALRILANSGLLYGDFAENNRNAIINHQYPECVADALKILAGAGLLCGDVAKDNRDVVANHRYPISAANALKILAKAGLLREEPYARANRTAIANHEDPNLVIKALNVLKEGGLLYSNYAQSNFSAIIKYQDFGCIIFPLCILAKAYLLISESGQENFNNLLAHSRILCEDEHGDLRIWSQIPHYLLTQDRYNEMISIANKYQDTPLKGRKKLVAFVNEVFNPAQNIHTRARFFQPERVSSSSDTTLFNHI